MFTLQALDGFLMTLDHMGTVLFVSDDCADYIGLTPVSSHCLIVKHSSVTSHCLIISHYLNCSHILMTIHLSYIYNKPYLVVSHPSYCIATDNWTDHL